MEIFVVQMICMCVLFVVLTFCGILPVILVARNKQQTSYNERTNTLISMCNCLAGGVFIGMCFLGLFPYVHEKFIIVLNNLKISTSFPVAEFVIIVGFFLILTLEQIIMKKHEEKEEKEKFRRLTMKSSTSSENKTLEDDESYVCLLDTESQESEGSSNRKKEENNKITNNKPCLKFVSGHSHNHMSTLLDESSSNIKHIMLLLAISIHSLFEGIALGLQTDQVKILHLFLAVLIHETLVAFALGVNIAKLNFGFLKSLKYVLTVTTSIPVGIILGLIIGAAPGIFGDIISAVFQAIASGIFIHVTFIELLPDEFKNGKKRLFKVAFFFIGYLIIAIVNFALGDHK